MCTLSFLGIFAGFLHNTRLQAPKASRLTHGSRHAFAMPMDRLESLERRGSTKISICHSVGELLPGTQVPETITNQYGEVSVG